MNKYDVRKSPYSNPQGRDISLDEPCFVIRAQDMFAVPALEKYIKLTFGTVSSEMTDELTKLRDGMREWQATHETKVPD